MVESVLHGELDTSVHALRGSLIDLIVSIGGDPRKPQEMSRRFGVDKSLCWKVSRVIKATDPSTALPHLPGDAAIEIFLNALDRAGAAHERLLKVRSAARSLQKTVEKNFGDRPTLDIILDSMPTQGEDRLVQSRKLAFRGNSGIWGVQGRVRVNTVFLAPNAEDPEYVDAALLGGWVDFRRLRPDSEWTLFRRHTFSGGQTITTGSIPFDSGETSDGPMLLRKFCSTHMPPIQMIEEGGIASYQLGPSAVGNQGSFSCFFGSLDRKLGSRFAEKPGDTADFYAIISAPVEVLLFDLYVHHTLSFAMNPEFSVYGNAATDPSQRKDRDVLPIQPAQQTIGSRPPVAATPLLPNYSEIIDYAFERAGWNLNDFVGMRYTLDYPPFLTTAGIKLQLDQR